MKRSLRIQALLAFFSLAVGPCFGQQGGDPSAQIDQVKQMCSDPKTAAMPMMASVCSGMSSLPADALKPQQQNTMQGGGPGFAKPVPGQEGAPGAAGATGAGAGQGYPGAVPQPGDQGDPGAVGGGGVQPAGGVGGGMTYGGGPGQSHIPSIRTGFRQMNKPSFKVPAKSPEKVKAEAAKKTKEEEEQKKALEKLAAEAKARAAADAEARAQKAAAALPAPVLPPPPPPPVPVYENIIAHEFMVEASLFKDVDASQEYFGPRRVTDVVIPPARLGAHFRKGIVWELMPDYRFSLCALEHDPFNLGLPKRLSLKRGFWDRLVDGVTGTVGLSKKRLGPSLIPYAAFESGAVDQRMDLLGAGGIVPMSLYWSGPEGALAGPSSSASQSRGVPAGTGLEPAPGEDDPVWLARQWGLEP
ncbi:MAG: hypothetical protein HY924_04595 [Elusimicrobia bacterium]|nr:hypothetical protein [Elusimicrobiota bacterium]